VKKLQKKQEYIIRTPNSVTYVRGTAFSVKYQKNLTEVALASGKIILKNKTGSEEVLKEGETAVISNNIHIRKISEIELLQIQKIMLLNFIRDSGPGKSSITEKQAGQYELELGKIDKEIEKLVETERIRREKELEKWKRLPPLERLRREGKIITMFHMRDGSRVAGSILSQDKAIIELDTGDGIIKIIKNEIIRRVKI
jgi:chromosome condensin MukBEF MukE localization factor